MGDGRILRQTFLFPTDFPSLRSWLLIFKTTPLSPNPAKVRRGQYYDQNGGRNRVLRSQKCSTRSARLRLFRLSLFPSGSPNFDYSRAKANDGGETLFMTINWKIVQLTNILRDEKGEHTSRRLNRSSSHKTPNDKSDATFRRNSLTFWLLR